MNTLVGVVPVVRLLSAQRAQGFDWDSPETCERLGFIPVETGLDHDLQSLNEFTYRWHCPACGSRWKKKLHHLNRCPGVPILTEQERYKRGLLLYSEFRSNHTVPEHGSSPVACVLDYHKTWYLWLYEPHNSYVVEHPRPIYLCDEDFLVDYFKLNSTWIAHMPVQSPGQFDLYEVHDTLWEQRTDYFLYLEGINPGSPTYTLLFRLYATSLSDEPDLDSEELSDFESLIMNVVNGSLFVQAQALKRLMQCGDTAIQQLLEVLDEVEFGIHLEILLHGYLSHYRTKSPSLLTLKHQVLYRWLPDSA